MRVSVISSKLLPFVLAVAGLALSCGTANDQESASNPESDTRYEIVIVDSSGGRVTEPATGDTEQETKMSATASAPAAVVVPLPPGIDDEAGGDDVVRYDPQGAYVVQVGVYANLAKARERVRLLVDLGYPAFLMKTPTHTKTRIRVGYFASRQDADHFGQRFTRDHGGEYWIDRRQPNAGGGHE